MISILLTLISVPNIIQVLVNINQSWQKKVFTNQIQDTKVLVDFNLIWMGVLNQQLDNLIKYLDCRLDFYQSVDGIIEGI